MTDTKRTCGGCGAAMVARPAPSLSGMVHCTARKGSSQASVVPFRAIFLSVDKKACDHFSPGTPKVWDGGVTFVKVPQETASLNGPPPLDGGREPAAHETPSVTLEREAKDADTPKPAQSSIFL